MDVIQVPMPMPPPLFAGVYRYRRASLLVLGGGAVLLCGAGLRHILSVASKGPLGHDEILSLVFFVVFLGVPFLIGCYLLIAFLADLRRQLEINDEGVLYGKRFTPWSRVEWFGAYNTKGCHQLAVELRGRRSKRHLLIDGGLSEEAFLGLVALLRERVGRRHPGLAIGEVVVVPDD